METDDQNSSYRDAIATVDESGKRIWVFPKKPAGRYYDKRKIVSYLLLFFLFTGPYFTWDGDPLFMFNILERKFILFGKIFWPQDFHIFAIGLVTTIIFVTLFTVIYGRLFCGWVCPQTIFMEMLFRRIEYWIEGDWKDQKRLKKAPWTKEKIIKKTIKQSIFWFISFLIANTFLAYIIGYKELLLIITDSPSEHIGGLMAILIFTTLFYLVFSKLREQVCTVICPYGRLQGVLLDNNSIQVSYDHKRGEGRAKFKKGEDRSDSSKGDCIDCNQCVNVCPTGIDIRNGSQLECINCTACMDACDFMMENVNLKKGLIRYASNNQIETGNKFEWTPRVKAYSVLLVVLVGFLTGIIVSRSDFETTILRTRGSLFHRINDKELANVYDITLVNKTNDSIPVQLKIEEGPGRLQIIGKELSIGKQAERKGKFMIIMPKDKAKSEVPFKIGVYRNEELIETVSTTFVGPQF